MPDNPLAREWAILQTQYFGYEKYSLVIKLIAVVLVTVSFFLEGDTSSTGTWRMFAITAVIVCILWLQDAIWKTFQTRIGARILDLERGLGAQNDPQDSGVMGYQLHTRFHAQRQSGGAMKQYLAQAMRPTVAYPYVALLGLLGFKAFIMLS